MNRESKTDETTVDLDSVIEMERTALADPLPSSSRFADRNAVEANIILIAHPHNEMLGTRFRLPPHGKLSIGRSSSANISMPEVQSLSRTHARLNHRGAAVEIEDLKSTNGTYVNDRRCATQVLRSGDRFQLGAAHFKFLHEQDPEHAYHEAIYHLVMTDGLTQAFNKRKLDEELAREFARARRHRRPLSLILFDIDRFKDVNDTFGHLCGDFILQQIARITSEKLRPEQVFARAGGEEFVIMSPEMELAGAEQLAEKLRQQIESEIFSYTEVEVRITCSFGVAGLEPQMERPEDLYEAADRAMYLSKSAGRNRVTCAVPSA